MLKNNGMTLLEVLVALAILAIALTAVLRVTASSIRQTTYLQQRSLASWIALDLNNRVVAGLMTPNIAGTMTFAQQQWRWQVTRAPSPNPAISLIHTTVMHLPDNTQLAQLTGYSDAPKK